MSIEMVDFSRVRRQILALYPGREKGSSETAALGEETTAHAHNVMMKLATCGLLLCANAAQAGLKEYSGLVVSDANATPPRHAIRVSYLGVNGYQFETGRHVLLIDPYFTRIGFWPVAFNQSIASNPNDFFSPLSSGFVFGKMTNFPQRCRTQTEEHLPGRMILLDYFRPWTLR